MLIVNFCIDFVIGYDKEFTGQYGVIVSRLYFGQYCFKGWVRCWGRNKRRFGFGWGGYDRVFKGYGDNFLV